MDVTNPLFFKMPYCARATFMLHGYYRLSCEDCKVEGIDLDPTQIFLRIVQNIDTVPKFDYLNVICFNRCTYDYVREWLTLEESEYIIRIGRENHIKGLASFEVAAALKEMMLRVGIMRYIKQFNL